MSKFILVSLNKALKKFYTALDLQGHFSQFTALIGSTNAWFKEESFPDTIQIPPTAFPTCENIHEYINENEFFTINATAAKDSKGVKATYLE